MTSPSYGCLKLKGQNGQKGSIICTLNENYLTLSPNCPSASLQNQGQPNPHCSLAVTNIGLCITFNKKNKECPLGVTRWIHRRARHPSQETAAHRNSTYTLEYVQMTVAPKKDAKTSHFTHQNTLRYMIIRSTRHRRWDGAGSREARSEAEDESTVVWPRGKPRYVLVRAAL